MVHNLYKKRGETPLQCIERFVEKNPDLKKEKMSYLGRLDPLAEGVLIVASGTDAKKREDFLALNKEYDFTCIFGFATDTYDIMGKITNMKEVDDISQIDLVKICSLYEGEREQEYPLYSSKMISSKESPLRKVWPSEASRSEDFLKRSFPEKKGKDIPTKKIKIFKIQFHGLQELSSKELFGRLLMDIGRVRGDFRQAEILNLWKDYLMSNVNSDLKYLLGRFSAVVSSGTYIRGIVNDMGKTFGCGATTLSIKRTQVGDYKIEDSLKF